ncbi:penicillin acylase family protein [Profundibacter amoris]|uniref:Penicillin acylase family protein n=1 Tax=Profundibacter amoris TaxID=2171755 RepID=A0A347UGC2_9RHOB|nr:penicillin acylase family protein [Profundibacter amoris]AXX97900.1 penicillin acylase family protein [Profundibacter amoris]
MAFIFRWLIRILVGLFVLTLLVAGTVYYLASRSLPDYDATHQVAGISGKVEIVRDNADVPHIFAENDRDAFYALGFAHAQDRLWQMTMLRRTAQGRLSEQFGRRTLEIDKLMRRLDIYNLAVRSVQAQDAKTLAALQAYSAGVNAWLTEINKEALGRGAPEFFLFSNEIAPWQPADSVAILKLMALQMSGHLEQEVIRAQASLILSPNRVLDILPDAPGTTTIAALPKYASLFPTVPRYATNGPTPLDPLSPFKPRAFAGASNAWAAAPSRSAAGGTLLANDPHYGFSAPSIWYLARLELAQGGIIGGTIPGIPAIMTGRSDYLGWGITTAYVDDQDVYIEKLNPDNPDEYLTPDGYKPFLTSDSIIRIKDEGPLTLKLQWSDNGPVLPGSHYDLGSITPAGHVTTVAWTALSPADTSVSALMGLMQAKTIGKALAQTKGYLAPALNLVLADGDSVAMKTIGAIPKRDRNSQTQGRIPSPGWIAANRWQGRMPYVDNPTFMNPAGGIVGNTNNKMIDRPFPRHVSFTWGDTQRVLRWKRLMQSREVHTRESFIEAQLDTVSYTARALLPLVAANLWFTGEAAPEGTPERQRQRALDLLANWNGEMNEHMPEPLIYAAWMRALQDRLIRDEMGPLSAKFTHVEPLFIERVFRNTDAAGAWCDILQSAATESCTDIARMALDDALLWIGENYSTNLEALRWGDAHQATHDHAVLGDIPVLKWFVNIRQSTSGGDNTLQRGRTRGGNVKPFQNVHGAGFRGVYDFADPDSSVFVISTGQSGHPLSRFYDNLGELWRRGEYIPMSLDPELARAAAAGITVLEPAK